MGRPLNKKFLGNPGDTSRAFPAVTMSSAWLPGQNAVATTPVYILKQTGTSRYVVSDGTNTGVVSLVNGEPTAAGQAAVYVTPFVAGSETGATFTATYKVTAAAVHSGAAGTGYNVGDVVSLGNGITVTVATLTGTAPNGIATVTVSAAGSRGTVNTAARSAVAQVSVNPGGGTGATFDLTYNLNNITIGGSGTGYTVGEQLTFTGLAATTSPTASIATVNGNGAPQTLTTTSGTNVTTSATSIATAKSLVKTYARVIKNRTVKSWTGAVYAWDPYAPASIAGEADIPRNISTGRESATYLAANESAIAHGSPSYTQVNVGPTAKQTQIFATSGIPGGSGAAPQATPNVGTSAGGIFNPSTTQRKANEKNRRDDKMQAARTALKAKTASSNNRPKGK